MRTKLLGEFWHECARTGNYYPQSKMRRNKSGQWIYVKVWDENEDET